MAKEKIKGGLADNLTPEDLARKHHQFIGTIEKEIELGIKIEYEHTNDKDKAREIAMDHIEEHPDYYSNPKYGLKAMEKKLEKDDETEKGSKNEGFLSVFNELIQEGISKHKNK